MMGLRHTVPEPKPTTHYQWDPYIDHGKWIELPPYADLSAVGSVHVYLAQLATKMGRISEAL
jgi:hypothetical protein